MVIKFITAPRGVYKNVLFSPGQTNLCASFLCIEPFQLLLQFFQAPLQRSYCTKIKTQNNVVHVCRKIGVNLRF